MASEANEKATQGLLKRLIFQSSDDPSQIADISAGRVGIDASLFVPKRLAFEKKMCFFLDEPITLDYLNVILRQTEAYYIKENYPIVVATLPPGQDITEGVVRISVMVGKLGCVKSEGARYFSNQRIASQIKTRCGEYIRKDRMLEDLDWINRNPMHSSDLIFEKGENVGETNVVLNNHDRFPFKPFIGYQNTGNKLAGRSRYYAGFDWGNVWNLDHQLNYQFMRATILDRFWSHSGCYIMPLSWRHIFKVFGYYSHTKPHSDNKLNLTGKGWQVSGRYDIPFRLGKIKSDVLIGYDFKRTNNFLEFVKNIVFNNYIDVSQFELCYQGHVQGSRSAINFGGSLVFSPGNMTPFNTNKEFRQERSGVQCQYLYGHLNFESQLRIFWDMMWWFTFKGQFSTQKLIPSEEFSVGGYLSVRGYLENQYIADNGLLVRNELRMPPIKFGKKNACGQLQFLAFFDYGKIWDADKNIRHRDAMELYSIGPGFRYHLTDHFNVWLDYGFQLIKPLTSSEKGSSRLHAGGTLSF